MHQVLSRLEEYGFKFNIEKMQLQQELATYDIQAAWLAYILESITDVTQIRRFVSVLDHTPLHFAVDVSSTTFHETKN